MNTILMRIREIISQLGLSDTTFAQTVGIGQTTLSNMFIRDSEPRAEFLHNIVAKYNVNAKWLLTGEGEMFQPEKETLPAEKNAQCRIPLLSQKVSCGPGQEWQAEQNIVEYVDIANLSPKLQSKDIYAFKASGTSMIGAGIKDGDIVLFSARADQELCDGIYVFGLDGDAYCKRLEFDPIANRIKIYSVRVADLEKAELLTTLTSTDPGYAERFCLFGRVFSWIHTIKD